MCTVLLRFAPGTAWPVLLAAIRDEFVGRPWDPPAAHWPGTRVVGGRDRVAGGTWLALRPGPDPAVAALLNGAPLAPPPDGVRPSRGALPLAALAGAALAGAALAGGALAGAALPEGADLARYDGFHLLVATPYRVELRSWDGTRLSGATVTPGDHIVVNLGLDASDDPLVPHFAPLLGRTATPDPRPGLPTAQAWAPWVDLLRGDGLAPDDPRALIIRHQLAGRAYGSTSATLVALGDSGARYDFSADPGPDAHWSEVALPATEPAGPGEGAGRAS